MFLVIGYLFGRFVDEYVDFLDYKYLGYVVEGYFKNWYCWFCGFFFGNCGGCGDNY